MNGLDDMNRALSYIEENLAGEIDFTEVARRAVCSEYHFTRIFSFLAGVTLSEYIRRRRMTLAAAELTRPGMRVIDVAVKYGYTSADAFTRAFKGVHGVTPTEAREAGQALKAYPRLHFELTIRGGDEMDYRIEEKDAFRVVGLMKRVPLIYRGVNPHIAAMWELLTGDMIAELKNLTDTEPKGMISASIYAEGVEEGSKLDQFIGVATTKDAPARFNALEVAPTTWAVFTVIGPFPDTLQDTWARIYAEWFPSSAYEQVEGPWILWNEHPDTTRPDYRSEIWVPVVKAQRE